MPSALVRIGTSASGKVPTNQRKPPSDSNTATPAASASIRSSDANPRRTLMPNPRDDRAMLIQWSAASG
jgi:hypothetical protein